MKLGRIICTILLASSLILLFCTAVPAEEQLPNDSIDAATGYEELAQIDREAMIEELVVHWGTDETTAYQLRGELEQTDDSKLLMAWDAESLDEIYAIMRGTLGLVGPLTLDDDDEDYTFTPITPCRIVDTRLAGGILSAGTSREFYVYGLGGLMVTQGGNAAGCDSPVMKPLGAMINVTAVPSSNGYLTVYPANVSRPLASLVNYRAGIPIANATAVKTFSGSGRELEVYSSQNSHVVIDVMGYYDMPERTPVETIRLTASGTVLNGGGLQLGTVNCPVTYTVTGGGCHYDSFNSAGLIINGNRPFNNGWMCAFTNRAGFNQGANAHAICTRTPGR